MARASHGPSPAPADPRAKHYELLALEVAGKYAEADIGTFQAVYSLATTYDAAFQFLNRRLAKYSITLAGFNVMMILSHGEYRSAGCPMHRLGDLLLVSRANVTGLVDNLERKGLVRRTEDAEDRRSKRVRVTPEGERRLRAILPEHLKTVRNLFGGLKEAEISRLRSLLQKLRLRVETERALEAEE